VPVAGLLWAQLFVFLLPAIAAAAAWNLDPRRALLVARRPPVTPVLLGLLIGLVGFLPAGAVMALVSLGLPREWLVRFDLAPLFLGPPWQRWALSIIAAVVAPICEEAAFRGHMLTLWRARLRPWPAIAVTSFLFAVLHLDPVRFVAVFLLGLLFGWLAWRSGSLWPAVAAHAANNATASLLVGSIGEAAAQRELPDPAAALMALAVGALLVAPLLLAYVRVTPVPPPASEALSPLDASPGGPRLSLKRIPPAVPAAFLLGVASLALIIVTGILQRT
jgi:membrane protease YdiL (CAAX protease family)